MEEIKVENKSSIFSGKYLLKCQSESNNCLLNLNEDYFFGKYCDALGRGKQLKNTKNTRWRRFIRKRFS